MNAEALFSLHLHSQGRIMRDACNILMHSYTSNSRLWQASYERQLGEINSDCDLPRRLWL